jgi:phosphoribosylanthranilate isomerase
MSGLIKICGIKTRVMLDHVVAQGVDMVGFVHFAKSPRHLERSAIEALVDAARGRIETAILLVDPDDALVAEMAALGPDYLQLHGQETPERVAHIAQTAIPVIKALGIETADDLDRVPGYGPLTSHLILDAKPPRDASRPGGLGQPFDWSLLKALDPAIGFMLSGGLTPETVANAVRTIRPAGLDVSSGVERQKGEKDSDLVTAFIANARAAYREIGME